MTEFPDEQSMPKSADGSEPIRGGSVGLNRILGYWVNAASTDKRPQFGGVIVNAFTIFRNVWNSQKDPTLETLETGFVVDLNLFLDYYDGYLSHVWNGLLADRYCPVIVYFPDYHKLPEDLRRERKGKIGDQLKLYQMFLAKHGNHNGEVKKLDHVRCFWITAGDYDYPHKEVAAKAKKILSAKDSMYIGGDGLCLITHVQLDLYITARLREVKLLESFTGELLAPVDFRYKLDKSGLLPFQQSVHIAMGDNSLIAGIADRKQRSAIMKAADDERWITRSADDVQNRVTKILGVPSSQFRNYDLL